MAFDLAAALDSQGFPEGVDRRRRDAAVGASSRVDRAWSWEERNEPEGEKEGVGLGRGSRSSLGVLFTGERGRG